MLRHPKLHLGFPFALLALATASHANSGVVVNANGSSPAPRSLPSAPDGSSLYWGDVDGDGLEDALVVDEAAGARLMLNFGSGRFEDITEASGLGAIEGATCALFADFDGDGRVDLYLGSSSKRVWRNLGNASFAPFESGIEHDFVDFAAVALAGENGLSDLQVRTDAGDLVYRNLGAGRFELVDLPLVRSSAGFGVITTQLEDDADTEEAATPLSPTKRRLRRWILARNATIHATSNSALMSTPGMTSAATAPPGLAATGMMICAGTIVDQANGQCIEASSMPMLGKLYPLSNDLFVTPAGYVGIGTLTPAVKLHVQDGALLVNGPTGGLGVFTSPGGGLSVQTNGTETELVSFNLSTSTYGDLQVRADVGGITIKKETGWVGIGTQTPTSKLTVAEGSLNVMPPTTLVPSGSLMSFGTPGGNVGMVIQRGNGSGGSFQRWDLKVMSDRTLRFTDVTANADRMSISSTGKVGIGTNAPQSGLTVTTPLSGMPTQQGVHLGNYPAPYEGSTGIKIVSATTGDPFIDFTTTGVTGEFGARLRYYKSFDELKVEGTAQFSVAQLKIRGGADIVESFESSCGVLEPGTVVAIDPENPGQLACSSGAYDTKVAGVVSGAGGVQPGMCLSQEGVLDGDTQVAMTGRVYVKCSAENGAIRPGDRLTTAVLAGHAMKVTDEQRSIGAVIGKAMTSLESGEGLVLVLVNLQ